MVHTWHTNVAACVHVEQIVGLHVEQIVGLHVEQIVGLHVEQIVGLHVEQIVGLHVEQIVGLHVEQIVGLHVEQIVGLHVEQSQYVRSRRTTRSLTRSTRDRALCTRLSMKRNASLAWHQAQSVCLKHSSTYVDRKR